MSFYDTSPEGASYRAMFYSHFKTINEALSAFDNTLLSIDLMQTLSEAGNDLRVDPLRGARNPRVDLQVLYGALRGMTDRLRMYAYAAALVACTLKEFVDGLADGGAPLPIRVPTEREVEAYTQFLVLVEAFWTELQYASPGTAEPVASLVYWSYKRDLEQSMASTPVTGLLLAADDPQADPVGVLLGVLLRLSLVADVVAEQVVFGM